MDDPWELAFLLAFAAGAACGYRGVSPRAVALGTLPAAAALYVGVLLGVGREPGETLLAALLYGSVWAVAAVVLLVVVVATGYATGEGFARPSRDEPLAPYDVDGMRDQRERAARLRTEVRRLLEPREVVEAAVYGIVADAEHTLQSPPRGRWQSALREVSAYLDDDSERPAAVVLTDRRLLFADDVEFVGQRSLDHAEILRVRVETARVALTGPVTRLTVELPQERIVVRATDEAELRAFVAAARRRFIVDARDESARSRPA